MDANPTLAQMLGYKDREEFLESVTDIGRDIYPDMAERQRMLNLLDKASPNEGISLEIELKRKDGTPFYAVLKVSIQVDDTGNPAFLNGTVEDIMQRKKAEAALRASEKKFLRLFQLSPDAITLVHLETNQIREINDAFIRLFRCSKDEALGHTPLDIGLSSSPARYEKFIRLLKDNGKLENFEFQAHPKGGAPVLCFLSCQILELGGDQYILAVFRDISEIKKMQEMMIQTEKMHSLGGIAAGIAHEINNPLGIILQASQNLARRIQPDFEKNMIVARELDLDMELLAEYIKARKLDSFIEHINSAAIRAAGIIRHMLDFTRYSESKRRLCDLPSIIYKALSLVENDYDLKKNYDFKNIKVHVDVADDLSQITCTETEIEQVFLNLFRNSAQAMAEAEQNIEQPQINVKIHEYQGMMRIEVQDNGPGMSPEVQRRIFEPFFTTKPPGIGTGLGLSVSYFIVTKGHGGRFSVNSKPGNGACFIIELPMKSES